ncbi:MAG TPA: dTDP-4-dehydrorhamnose reductase [Chloroflexi bacterium]|nr:dTDP-4-dehydrorhamnose reductase [Chloroflexota bacterium]
MRYLIIGANGQLGSDLVCVFQGEDLVALTHQEIEIRDIASIRGALRQYSPDLVINTAAYHKVDLCEDRADEAFAVNALGVRNVAMVCREQDCALMHFSTDYVFDGRKGEPYVEEDLPGPLNAYGVSKLAGECFVRAMLDRYFLLRTSGLFGTAGSSGKGGNFIETMLRLASEGKAIRVVADQVLSPTYTLDLARQIEVLVSGDNYGLYHATSHGACSWYQFAAKIFELEGIAPELSPQTTAESGSRAVRPAYSELDNQRLRTLGLDRMRSWEEGLADYLVARRATRGDG